jgi:hypothetical protein
MADKPMTDIKTFIENVNKKSQERNGKKIRFGFGSEDNTLSLSQYPGAGPPQGKAIRRQIDRPATETGHLLPR